MYYKSLFELIKELCKNNSLKFTRTDLISNYTCCYITYKLKCYCDVSIDYGGFYNDHHMASVGDMKIFNYIKPEFLLGLAATS